MANSISQRRFDYWYIFYFTFNLIVAVSIFDTTMILVPSSCLAEENCPNSLVEFIYQQLYENDRLGFEKPAWFMVTIWCGILLWGPFYIVAIYAFYMGDNRIRIPTIMYCTAMSMIYAMLIAENTIGQYKRKDSYSFWAENFIWLITIPMLMIKMLKTDKPFGEQILTYRKKYP